MNVMQLPIFGKYVDALHMAGIETGSARQFWGGVTSKGDIVVTTWADADQSDGSYKIWRPNTNHGGLLGQWDVGSIAVGRVVRLIMLRQRGSVPLDQGPREVKDAALMHGKWKVVRVAKDGKSAFVEPVA